MENKVEINIQNKHTVIMFFGELISSETPKYRALIDSKIINRSGDVILDFHNTTFIDSSGIGLVLGRYNNLRLQDRKIIITGLSKTSYKLFELTGIFKIMEYKETMKC